MYNCDIEVVQATPNPAELVARVARLTQMNPYKETYSERTFNKDLAYYLYKAEHRSVFQHTVMTVYVTGLSRALADQIRTAHHLSVTSTSQHYADHRDFPIVCGWRCVQASCERAMEDYKMFLYNGVPKEEARMALPMATGAALYITGNAQAWASFLHQRLCNRNVMEMRLFANRMQSELINWFPELFRHVGPQCTESVCRQGRMQCKEKMFSPIPCLSPKE